MKFSKCVFLIPLLAPLLATVLISLSNLNKPSKLRILTYTLPPISIGLLILAGASCGALTMASFITLSSKGNIYPRRRVHIEPTYNIGNEEKISSEPLSNQSDSFNDSAAFNSDDINEILSNRDPRDPPPTISVPYKVVKRTSQRYSTNAYDSDDLMDSDNDYALYNEDQVVTETTQGINDWDLFIEEDW